MGFLPVQKSESLSPQGGVYPTVVEKWLQKADLYAIDRLLSESSGVTLTIAVSTDHDGLGFMQSGDRSLRSPLVGCRMNQVHYDIGRLDAGGDIDRSAAAFVFFEELRAFVRTGR